MKEPFYRQTLSFGWRFAWKHKFLWIYGLFAAALGQMGAFDILSKVTGAVMRTAGGVRPFSPLWHSGWAGRGALWGGLWSVGPMWVWLLWMMVVCLGFLALFTVVAVVSQGALIHAAAQAKNGRAIAMDSREWHAGVSHFWRLFFLQAAKKFIIMALAAIVGWSAYAAIALATPASLLLFLLLFLVAMAVGLFLSFFVIYAAGYIVVEEYDLGEALAAAWRLTASHWLVSLEIGMIFFVLNILLALAAVVGIVLLLVPAALLWFVAILLGNQVLFGAVVGLLGLSFVAVVMWMGSVFTVFSTSVWTHAFMQMHRYGLKSRVVHWLSHRN
ncbi:MAG: hypothetical protein WC822_05275 [Candidatus Paceibacterota bacterium]|jgi:hypothetical protein